MTPIRLLAALMLSAAFVAPHVVAQNRLSLAAEQQQQPPKKEQPPAPLVGELVTVDVNAKTFAIKTASEGEVKFSYTDTTEIVGADKGASGLAATPGAEVTVHYDSHGTARVATRIEVRPRK
jgi:hypothetical protein